MKNEWMVGFLSGRGLFWFLEFFVCEVGCLVLCLNQMSCSKAVCRYDEGWLCAKGRQLWVLQPWAAALSHWAGQSKAPHEAPRRPVGRTPRGTAPTRRQGAARSWGTAGRGGISRLASPAGCGVAAGRGCPGPCEARARRAQRRPRGGRMRAAPGAQPDRPFKLRKSLGRGAGGAQRCAGRRSCAHT